MSGNAISANPVALLAVAGFGASPKQAQEVSAPQGAGGQKNKSPDFSQTLSSQQHDDRPAPAQRPRKAQGAEQPDGKDAVAAVQAPQEQAPPPADTHETAEAVAADVPKGVPEGGVKTADSSLLDALLGVPQQDPALADLLAKGSALVVSPGGNGLPLPTDGTNAPVDIPVLASPKGNEVPSLQGFIQQPSIPLISGVANQSNVPVNAPVVPAAPETAAANAQAVPAAPETAAVQAPAEAPVTPLAQAANESAAAQAPVAAQAAQAAQVAPDASPVKTAAPKAPVAPSVHAQAKTQTIAAAAEKNAAPVELASAPEPAHAALRVDVQADSQKQDDSASASTQASSLAPGVAAPAPRSDAPATSFAQLLQQQASPNTHGASPADQMLAQVRQAARDGENHIRIQLNPVELGKLDIHLAVGVDGKTTLNITADNARTLHILQSDARQLEQRLTDIGLKADAGSLNFNLSGDQQSANQYQAQDHKQGHAPYRSKQEEADALLAAAPLQTYVLADADGLDISI